MVRRPLVALLAVLSLAVAAAGGVALARAVRAPAFPRAAPSAVATAFRPGVNPVPLPRGSLRPLRARLGALLGRVSVRPHARILNMRSGSSSCPVGATQCSLHPCVEFATAAPSSAVAMLTTVTKATRTTVGRTAVRAGGRRRSCRAVPAVGQTRLVPVVLRR